MNIVDKKNAAKEIANLITTKAMYQKVVFCLDENSDTKLLDEVCDTVGRNAIIIKYIYSKKSTPDFFNLINNGVRIVVYNVASENYYRVKNNNSFILNVFVAQSDFVLPYIGCVDSLYGYNMLVVNKSGRDYCSVLRMYELALDDVWSKLLQGVSVNTDRFKCIDRLVNCDNFYNEILSIFKGIKSKNNNDCSGVDESEIGLYVYLKASCILRMLQMVDCGEERYIDFYKNLKTSNEINKAYNLVFRCDVVDTIRLHCKKLIKITTVIIDRIKIINKKYLNNKNFNTKKLIKIIQNNAISLNIDSLIYVSYIFNCVKII